MKSNRQIIRTPVPYTIRRVGRHDLATGLLGSGVIITKRVPQLEFHGGISAYTGQVGPGQCLLLGLLVVGGGEGVGRRTRAGNAKGGGYGGHRVVIASRTRSQILEDTRRRGIPRIYHAGSPTPDELMDTVLRTDTVM